MPLAAERSVAAARWTTEGAGGGGGPGGGGFPNIFGISYISVVKQGGGVVEGLECPAYVADHSYRPQLPAQISGFSTQPDGSEVAYFTDRIDRSGRTVLPRPGARRSATGH